MRITEAAMAFIAEATDRARRAHRAHAIATQRNNSTSAQPATSTQPVCLCSICLGKGTDDELARCILCEELITYRQAHRGEALQLHGAGNAVARGFFHAQCPERSGYQALLGEESR